MQQIFDFLSVGEYSNALSIVEKFTPDELAELLQSPQILDHTAFLRELNFEQVCSALVKFIVARNFSQLKPLLATLHASEIAKLFDEIEHVDIPLVFRILPKDLAAETFVEMDVDLKERLISRLSDKELRAVMDELFLDDAVDMIEEMPASVVKRVLAQSDNETRAYINEILKYPKDSAGSIMTIEYVSLKARMTVEEAFERIRKTAIDKETIYTCYVTDATNKLIGLVTAKDLLLAKKTASIEEIMNENVIYAHTDDDKETTARRIYDYGFLALPIVDNETRLVGIVTVDDAMDVLQEENTEDIAKMAAVTPTDKPYLKTGIWRICINRLPWLLLLLLSSTFSGLIISANENTLNMPIYGIVLTACMPMLMGTGGNAGSQASAMIIRSLAIGEVKFSDFWKVVWKEIRVSVILGAILSVACFIKVLLVDRVYAVAGGTTVAFVVSISMLATVVIAKLVGAMLPLLAKKCKLDPAVVASPFITTMVDVLSLTIYCAFAVFLLGTV